ncbi:MAG: regulatory iron-sulfur-containing complex subunit RicT [Patescibacteria group bacterium]|nr:regulatory iron-sulfur-containing complex subunit RicT [Patescibacteria group bacterium]
MKISVKVFPWDDSVIFDSGNWSLLEGDIVIVNVNSGVENGIVEKINVESKEEVSTIVRKATSVDFEVIEKNKEKGEKAVKVCKKLTNERKLAMKIVSARFSFDGGKIVFSFIAERRVDFRDLVKSLSKKFQRSIRLQQIGSRDEARGKMGFGICGRELCCIKFSGNLKSVTTEDAKVQQMGQRGSERLSGLCGRLKCCLGFESEQYKDSLSKMPNIGKKFIVENKKVKVVELDVLANKVLVEFESKNKKKVHISELGKCL